MNQIKTDICMFSLTLNYTFLEIESTNVFVRYFYLTLSQKGKAAQN